MSPRITDKNLQAVIDRINSVTESPTQPYVTINNPDGTTRQFAQVGNFHIDHAYGGVQLVQMVNEGGVRDVLGTGHVPKRQLYDQLHAYLAGLYHSKR